jgi:hypothetical protein
MKLRICPASLRRRGQAFPFASLCWSPRVRHSKALLKFPEPQETLNSAALKAPSLIARCFETEGLEVFKRAPFGASRSPEPPVTRTTGYRIAFSQRCLRIMLPIGQQYTLRSSQHGRTQRELPCLLVLYPPS